MTSGKLPPARSDESAALFKIVIIILTMFFIAALFSSPGRELAGRLLRASLNFFM